MSTRTSFTILGGLTLAVTMLNCSWSAGTFTPGAADAAPTCDTSKCAEGNECIEDQGVTECRLTCTSQRGATGCPASYSCITTDVASFCKPDKVQVTLGEGQYGAHCTSLDGKEAAECDQAQGFFCQYIDRNDPNAFCTRYDCATDDDCTGGYYCGSANDIPAKAKQARTIGATHKVCLPRAYCAPCTTDLDCAPADDGTKQFCTSDSNGVNFCTKNCLKDTNCPDEAKCKDDGDHGRACIPIAGTCVGDGLLCSPCRSDADCAAGGGACVKSRYSTEKTCTVPSKVKCDITGDTAVFDCPKDLPPNAAKDSFASCVGQVFNEVPLDQCSGLVVQSRERDETGALVPSYQVGCYARERK